jgi:HK97 gp10 family phage protein
MINLKVTGSQDILRRLRKVTKNVDEIAAESVFLTANLVKNTAVKSIQSISMGERVRRPRQGGGTLSHIASRPGDAPNTDTGNLVKSISVQPLQPKKTMTVGVNSKYGAALEFGTKNMEARPYMQPSVEENKDALDRFLANKLKALLA